MGVAIVIANHTEKQYIGAGKLGDWHDLIYVVPKLLEDWRGDEVQLLDDTELEGMYWDVLEKYENVGPAQLGVLRAKIHDKIWGVPQT